MSIVNSFKGRYFQTVPPFVQKNPLVQFSVVHVSRYIEVIADLENRQMKAGIESRHELTYINLK